MTEVDSVSGAGPVGLKYQHAGTVYASVYPNPYTTTLYRHGQQPRPRSTFEDAQTFQIFSAGADGLYGVGGQFIAPSTASCDGQQSVADRCPRIPTRSGIGGHADREHRLDTQDTGTRQPDQIPPVGDVMQCQICQLSVVKGKRIQRCSHRTTDHRLARHQPFSLSRMLAWWSITGQRTTDTRRPARQLNAGN